MSLIEVSPYLGLCRKLGQHLVQESWNFGPFQAPSEAAAGAAPYFTQLAAFDTADLAAPWL
jgi:hypothetical protein